MYNKSAIMRSAWETYRAVRYECERRELAKGFIPIRFQNALSAAWSDAKRAVARPRTADELYARINEIECSADFLTASDRAEINTLHVEIRDLSKPLLPETTMTVATMRQHIGARLQQMRRGTTAGLSRENWEEIGALRDRLCNHLSTSV